MISKPQIAKWKEHAPWKDFDQVEQDLVISRALVAIFSDEMLRANLAFRGGTALHKLYLNPAPRYSEDIDLVQVVPGPIGPILDRVKAVLHFFEEKARTKVGGHGAKVLYRFQSEYSGISLRLKVEINGKEHFNVLDWVYFPFKIDSEWFSGIVDIRTYSINELLGTKMRALYQRSKGRDLFDLDYARRNMELDTEAIIECFKVYTTFSTGNRPPSIKEYVMNMEEKMQDPNFKGDMEALLRPEITYDQAAAYEWLQHELIAKI